MAKPNSTLYRLTATTILIFLIISQSASARPLNSLNPSTQMSEIDSSEQVFPCEEMASDQNSATEFASEAKTRLGGRYGPLFLSMLPKGPVTPSGPSKGTNDDNN